MEVTLMCTENQRQYLHEMLFNDDADIVMYGGARGPGKTHIDVLAQVLRRLYHPVTPGIIIRKTQRAADQTLKTVFDRIHFGPPPVGLGLPPGVVQWLEGDKYFRYANGSKQYVVYCNKDSDYEQFMSGEYPDQAWEELTQHKQKAFQMVGGSCRAPASPRKIKAKKSGNANPGGQGHCVPYGDVLTPQGWRPIESMREGDAILTVTPDGYLKKTVVAQVHREWGDTALVDVEARGLTICCTPNHQVAKVGGTRAQKNTLFSLVRFSELPGQATILRSVGWEGEPLEPFSPAPYPTRARKLNQPSQVTGRQYAELLGWWLSEGHTVDRDKAFGIAQSKTVQRNRIKALLDECGFEQCWSDNSVLVYAPDWWNHFKAFGKCRDKFIPQGVLNSSTKDLTALFNALMAGDGHWMTPGESGQYYTISKRLADDVSHVAVKLGFVVNVNSRQREDRRGLTYIVNFKTMISGGTEILTGQHKYEVATQTKRKSKMSLSSYRGFVYCLGIEETHSFVIRQQGSVWVSGNSWVKESIKESHDPNIIFIPARPMDNMALLENDPGYIDRELTPLPEWQRRQWRDGDWDAGSGQYFNFNREQVREMVIPHYASWYGGVDWGRSAPFCCLFIAAWEEPYSGEHHVHVRSEIYKRNLEIDEQAQAVIRREKDLIDSGELNAERVTYYADPAVGKPMEGEREEQGRTIRNTWQKYGFKVLPARTNVRVTGWELVKMLMKHGILTINPSCKALLTEILGAIYEGTDNGGEPTGEDISVNVPDHALDAIRYFAVSKFGVRFRTDQTNPYTGKFLHEESNAAATVDKLLSPD